MKSIIFKLTLAFLLASQSVIPVMAGIDPFIGEIQLVAFNFCPRGFFKADGQILSIAQNSALFSLLGTTYGGNGVSTFGLPDLRGRVPLNWGQGPGLSNYTIGEVGGLENTTLIVSNLPSHTHNYNFVVKSGRGAQTSANGAFLAESGIFRDTGTNVNMASQTTAAAGSATPFSTMQPYLGLTYCIATEGIYPSRP